MRNKLWCYKNRGTDLEELNRFSAAAQIPLPIAQILKNRGITDPHAARIFLKKPLEGIHNPFELPDMRLAAERIKKAVEDGEKIVVYGDYDVDGVTSTVILYSFLKKLGANAEYYIPDRVSEGYGINIMAINRIARGGAKLMVTVDCGVTAVGEVEFARTQALDVIITDHHTCKDELPRAVAVVNPKRPDSEYPFSELCGAGVAFKLVMAIAMEMGRPAREVFDEYSELAAVGTVADVVPLLDENRIIVERGLDVMRTGGNLGVHALLAVSGALERPINSTAIAFCLAPRINAAGRLGSSGTAVELLLADNAADSARLAAELDSANRERQKTEQEIFAQANETLLKDPLFDKKKVMVIAGEGWHHGVIGIVASRLCDRYYKPCILISYENGVGKGSGRSIAGFNLFDALTACEEHLTNFGGHAMAAGLGINADEIAAFDTAINKYADTVLSEEDMLAKIDIDCRLRPETASLGFAHALELLEPFGQSNEKPVFSILGARITAIDTVGTENKHLRVRLSTGEHSFSAIGFSLGEYSAFFRRGDPVDAAFSLDVNKYMGSESVQLLLKDLKKHSQA